MSLPSPSRLRIRFPLVIRWWPLVAALLVGIVATVIPRNGRTTAEWLTQGVLPWAVPPSFVIVEKVGDNHYQYMVNGVPTVFIGMGYNPIYRNLTPAQRAANYRRDFKILCEAGVNHITGWDADKGYEQDKFDELTLDLAQQYGIGVLMPLNLPPEGNYRDPAFLNQLRIEAVGKINRFKNHPALRMWGVGNEVLTEMPRSMYVPFGRFYRELADIFHELDPDHPVIYREAEDIFIRAIGMALSTSGPRPWFQYGMNVYSLELERILDEWPQQALDRPLFVSEFGAEDYWYGDRVEGYVNMWRTIRSHPEYVLGGAPYVWTTEGPEPTDKKWGLMDDNSRPIDGAFEGLAAEWRQEPDNLGRTCPP